MIGYFIQNYNSGNVFYSSAKENGGRGNYEFPRLPPVNDVSSDDLKQSAKDVQAFRRRLRKSAKTIDSRINDFKLGARVPAEMLDIEINI